MLLSKKEKVSALEAKNFNWFEIADLLDMTYDEVRGLSENEDENNG